MSIFGRLKRSIFGDSAETKPGLLADERLAARKTFVQWAGDEAKPSLSAGEKLAAQQHQVTGAEDGVVTDTRTGLMWMHCPLGQTWDGTTCIGRTQAFTWGQAMALRHSFAGYGDWRLPSIDELKSIVDKPTDFPRSIGGSTYWSSSPDLSSINHLPFSMSENGTDCRDYPERAYRVRLVRGSQSLGAVKNNTTTSTAQALPAFTQVEAHKDVPSNIIASPIREEASGNFIICSDGTVTDTRTELMWMRCALGQTWDGTTCTGEAKAYTWDQAMALRHSFAGHDGWRLPSIDELKSIVDKTQMPPAIDTISFPNASDSIFWSCSPDAGHLNYAVVAWSLGFGFGYASVNHRSEKYKVRLVRGGQALGTLNDDAISKAKATTHNNKLSEKASEIAINRPRCWEHALFAQVIADEIERQQGLASTLSSSTMTGVNSVIVRIDSSASLKDCVAWAQSKLTELADLINQFLKLLSVTNQEDAFGPLGQPGDPEKIAQLGIQVGKLYANALVFANVVRAQHFDCSHYHIECLRADLNAALTKFRDNLTAEASAVAEVFGPEILRRMQDAVSKIQSGESHVAISMNFALNFDDAINAVDTFASRANEISIEADRICSELEQADAEWPFSKATYSSASGASVSAGETDEFFTKPVSNCATAEFHIPRLSEWDGVAKRAPKGQSVTIAEAPDVEDDGGHNILGVDKLESTHRINKRLERALELAKLNHGSASIEDINPTHLSEWEGADKSGLNDLKHSVIQGSMITLSFRALLLKLNWEWRPHNKYNRFALARLLESSDIGLEPDLDYVKPPKPDDMVVLFAQPLDDESPRTTSAYQAYQAARTLAWGERSKILESPHSTPAYQVALLTLQLSSTVAIADGDFCDVEKNHLREQILSWSHLTPNHQQRLLAHLELLKSAPASLANLKKKLGQLDVPAKESIAAFMATVAQADGVVLPAEVKILEQIYKALGVDHIKVFSDLHAFTTEGKPSSAAVKEIEETGFTLDPERIIALQRDTEKVTALLAGIFTEDEPILLPVQKTEADIPDKEEIHSILGLDKTHAILVRKLLSRPQWCREELLAMAADLELMLDGALELINEASFDMYGLAFAEGDDPFVINPEVLEQIEP